MEVGRDVGCAAGAEVAVAHDRALVRAVLLVLAVSEVAARSALIERGAVVVGVERVEVVTDLV